MFSFRKISQRLHHTARREPAALHSILDAIGNTPVVRVNNVGVGRNVNLYAKLEYFNPLSSVKDRLALGVIEDAERSGALKPGTTVVEATSGNTGIAIAMVCAQKGYPCVITMAESFSVERRRIMRMLGAKVILTPAAEKGTGMVKKAEELASKHGWFYPKQFENEANTRYHANTTGPEILRCFADSPLDYFVSGYGTGGTFTGVGTALRAASPNTKIILSEPENAAILSSGKPQVKGKTHEAFTPHPIQGWTPDFIPEITARGRDQKLYDEILLVSGEEAMKTSRLLASKEGIFTGVSGGATFATALKVAEKAPEGSNILAMIPDTAERYLSTPLFQEIEAEMNDEEKDISKSTPGFQL